MDTSKFSLPEALHVLRPYFEWLTFKPLSVYVSDKFEDELFKSSPCHRWPKLTMMPACVSLDERVYAIPLHCTLQGNWGNSFRLIDWRLLVRRDLESFSVCYLQISRVSWCLRYGRPPSVGSTITLVDCDKFVRTRSLEDDISDSVKLKRDVFVRKYGPLDLRRAFWNGAQTWAQESLEPRKKALDELAVLAQQCSERY